jgi:hypothetical protein
MKKIKEWLESQKKENQFLVLDFDYITQKIEFITIVKRIKDGLCFSILERVDFFGVETRIFEFDSDLKTVYLFSDKEVTLNHVKMYIDDVKKSTLDINQIVGIKLGTKDLPF